MPDKPNYLTESYLCQKVECENVFPAVAYFTTSA